MQGRASEADRGGDIRLHLLFHLLGPPPGWGRSRGLDRNGTLTREKDEFHAKMLDNFWVSYRVILSAFTSLEFSAFVGFNYMFSPSSPSCVSSTVSFQISQCHECYCFSRSPGVPRCVPISLPCLHNSSRSSALKDEWWIPLVTSSEARSSAWNKK